MIILKMREEYKNLETFIYIFCDGAEMIGSENIIYLKTTAQYFI